MGAAPHPKYHSLTIIATAVAAVLVLGGGSFTAALFISQQQTSQLSQPGADARVAAASASASTAVAEPSALASASAESSAEPSAEPSASASAVVAAHADWNDINGKWCGSQGCITIVGLKNAGDSSSHYVHDRGKDPRGCLWGYTGAGGVENTATVTYCPQGAPFVDPAADCGTVGDVTRERLYVRQYCVDPYYRG